MSEKVILPKEVAKELDNHKQLGTSSLDIMDVIIIGGNTFVWNLVKTREFAQQNFDEFLSALVNGYEVEKTPEDKVRKLYENWHSRLRISDSGEESAYISGKLNGLKETIDSLEYEIPGVNVNK